METERNIYDEIPYSAATMPYAQPTKMAVIGQLFSMNVPPPQTARILEIGCADGSNILATAYGLPNAQCVGVDYSQLQISMAQQAADNIGLRNLTLRAMNVMDFELEGEPFDYIITHGVFSWVTQEVREKILAICQHRLSDNGLVYISYNTYPGWNMRKTLRDLMLYHTAQFDDNLKRIEQLKAIMQFVAEATSEGKDAYSLYLNQEFSLFKGLPEAYLFHDFLEEDNQPFYFHEFMALVRGYGLEYLGDTNVHTMISSNFQPKVAEILKLFNNDLVKQEQYMDFVRNRQFRHTVLCRQGVPLQRSLTANLMTQFAIASSLEQSPESPITFVNRHGNMRTENPVVQTAFRYLRSQWPRAVRFETVAEQTARLLLRNQLDEAEQFSIAEAILRCFVINLLELHVEPQIFVNQVSQFPRANPFARWQVAQKRPMTTNLRYEAVRLGDSMAYHLIPLLDGQHDLPALCQVVEKWVQEGKMQLNVKNERGEIVQISPKQREESIKQSIVSALRTLAQSALLEA